MPKKNTKKAVAVVATPKVKTPKFKLISYTLKAVIPTGQYANIQPEITVQSVSIEAAERAVMPYIESLFAKYRDGGVKPVEAVAIKPVTPTPIKPVSIPVQKSEMPVVPPVAAAAVVSPIVLTVPFNRAKGAIESCMSKEALKLVSDQIEKSTKLIDSEKEELKKLVADKTIKLNSKIA